MRLQEFANVSNEALCHQISWNHHIKKYEMGEACGMHEGEKKGLPYFGRKSRRKRLLWILRRSSEDNSQSERTVIAWKGVYRNHLDGDKDQ